MPEDIVDTPEITSSSYTYPYKHVHTEFAKKEGHYREGIDYSLWVKEGIDLQEVLNSVSKPVVEIAGPTLGGIYFLDDLRLPSKPIFTNVEHAEWIEDEVPLDQIVDVREMPYENESLGVIIMFGLNSHPTEIDVNSEESDQETAKAFEEINRVALGTLNPSEAKHSLRIQAYLEAYRTLESGGIFFGNGQLVDLIVLERLGFKPLAIHGDLPKTTELGPTGDYEFVLQKS